MQPPICPEKLKKLLVCTDGSENSRAALAEAMSLARACGSQVYLLQVVAIIPEFEAAAPDLMVLVGEEVSKQLAAIKAEAAETGVTLETRMSRGVSVPGAILQEAEEIQPDMIVMGRYGRTGLARLLVGSVTARVIGHSPFNVLVVPKGATISFERILIASDGSSYSQAAFAEALALARGRESKIFGVSVAAEEGEIPRAQEIVHQMLTAANQAGLPLQGSVPQGQPPDDGIIQAAIKNEVDLIVMGSHGRTGLKRLLMGSVTERVIGQAPCPVLVVKK
ncbi:MAG: universal stress protein [Deltaproteobacteria bacterium]|nr:universal stress protein [Deltaproteobacteria bacterium]MBI4795083.1 universal stress protein [Deltaproteobacteria bacterium]